MGDFAQMIVNDYDIKHKGILKRNPQANAIIERAHQTIGNMIRTFEVYNDDSIDEANPWSGILSATMFAMRATYHTTLQATPMQLVFSRDAIMNTTFEANWHVIKERKQTLIRKNNERENRSRIKHTYNVGDKVLYKPEWKSKFGEPTYQGPYRVQKVNDNGTLVIRQGVLLETVNIRLLKPYKE